MSVPNTLKYDYQEQKEKEAEVVENSITAKKSLDKIVSTIIKSVKLSIWSVW